MRIFDNPNHPQYGPVRRMWVVLVQLDLLNAAERWSEHSKRSGKWTWDARLAFYIEASPQVPESIQQRAFIYILLEGWA